jgi:hypothetical protein
MLHGASRARAGALCFKDGNNAQNTMLSFTIMHKAQLQEKLKQRTHHTKRSSTIIHLLTGNSCSEPATPYPKADPPA